MTFEISNRTDVNAATADTTSTPVQLPANATDRLGFAIVNNNVAGAYGTGALYGNYPLYGEARVVDTLTGLYLGYTTNDLHTVASGNPDFIDAAGNGPDASVAPALFPHKVLSWFSTGAVDSTWYVLPLGTETTMAFTNTTTITYQVQNSNQTAGGHYNNNEVFRSSTATFTAPCLGTVNRSTLLDPIVATHSVNGGWGTFSRTLGATNALVYKNEVLQPGMLGGVGQFVTRVPVL